MMPAKCQDPDVSVSGTVVLCYVTHYCHHLYHQPKIKGVYWIKISKDFKRFFYD